VTEFIPNANIRRVDDVRYIGSLDGRYILASRERRRDISVKVFACRIKSITPRRVVLAAPVSGVREEGLTVQVNDLGVIKAQIEDHLEFGFSALIRASEEERLKLAAKIDWIKKRTLYSWPDQREHRRVPPKNPQSRLILGDGTVMDCFLIDISRSGAAISADIAPAIGTPLAVGKIVARVVRHLDVGFAVQFVQTQDQDDVEDQLSVG
jgi:hypothetical protein